MFKVSIVDDLPLSALIEKDLGVMSPHAGNFKMNRMGLTRLFRALVYTGTYGRADDLFRPDYVMCGGKLLGPITEADVMMTHAKVSQQCGGLNGHSRWFPEGALVAKCHLAALKKAVPDTRAVHYPDYLQEHAECLLKMVEVVTKIRPDIWETFVEDDGGFYSRAVRDWDELSRVGILCLSNNRYGWKLPNVLNILLSAVIESMDRDTDRVYFLSGASMHGYVCEFADLLSELYDHLAKSLPSWGLTETLHYVVVPAAQVRFITTMDQKAELDALLAAYLVWREFDNEKCRRMRALRLQEARIALARSLRQAESERKLAVKVTADAVPDIFFPSKGVFRSQYDLLSAKEARFYIHPFALDHPVAEVVKAFKKICQFAGHKA